MLTDRESDVWIEIVRVHGKGVLAGHGVEVDRAAVPLKPARGPVAANAADLKMADRLTTGQEVDRLTVAYPVIRVDQVKPRR